MKTKLFPIVGISALLLWACASLFVIAIYGSYGAMWAVLALQGVK